MLELLEEPLAMVRLPVVSVEWLVDTAVRPKVSLANAPAPVLARGVASELRPPHHGGGSE